MRKSKPINIIVHSPADKNAFEKLYIDATLEAIMQLVHKTPKKKHLMQNEDNTGNDKMSDCPQPGSPVGDPE